MPSITFGLPAASSSGGPPASRGAASSGVDDSSPPSTIAAPSFTPASAPTPPSDVAPPKPSTTPVPSSVGVRSTAAASCAGAASRGSPPPPTVASTEYEQPAKSTQNTAPSSRVPRGDLAMAGPTRTAGSIWRRARPRVPFYGLVEIRSASRHLGDLQHPDGSLRGRFNGEAGRRGDKREDLWVSRRNRRIEKKQTLLLISPPPRLPVHPTYPSGDDFGDEAGALGVVEVVDGRAVHLGHAARADDRVEDLARVARRLHVHAGLQEPTRVAADHVRHVLAAVAGAVGDRVGPEVDARIEERAAVGQLVGRHLVEEVLEVARVDAIDLVVQVDGVGDGRAASSVAHHAVRDVVVRRLLRPVDRVLAAVVAAADLQRRRAH